MEADARRTRYIEYQLIHPDLRRLAGNELAEFYALLHGAYPLEECRHLGDRGGIIETEGFITLNLEREGFSYSENVRDPLDVVLNRAAGVWAMARGHFEIPFYLVAAVEVRQLWHVPEIADVPGHLSERVVKITPEQFEPLGEGTSVALDLAGNAGAFHWHLKLAPWHREPGTLFLELEAFNFPPNEEGDALRDALDRALAFLDDNVTKFVMGTLG